MSLGLYNQTDCAHKRAYSSWARAKRAAHRLNTAQDENTHPYVCKVCGAVHIGRAGIPRKRKVGP